MPVCPRTVSHYSEAISLPVGGAKGESFEQKAAFSPLSTPDWDEHLTLDPIGVVSLEIQPTQDAITVFLASDATVSDPWHEPYAGWGQKLPCCFRPDVAVSRQAKSGLALRSFAAKGPCWNRDRLPGLDVKDLTANDKATNADPAKPKDESTYTPPGFTPNN